MTPRPSPTSQPQEPAWLTSAVEAEPRLPLMGPYLAYLLLMLPAEFLPLPLQTPWIAVHIVLGFWVVWLLRNHFPPLGRWFSGTALIAGAVAAAGWVIVERLLSGVNVMGFDLGGRFFLYSLFSEAQPAKTPPELYGSGATLWIYITLKIARATLLVPVIEELFWRGFVLRALIDWNQAERLPPARFTWFSFLGSSFLSIFQHPDQWAASVCCWMLFNALFYRTKSLRCLMLTHGLTNLFLYIYVVRSGDWQFW